MSNTPDQYKKRYDEERKINVYFLQMKNAAGARHYFYIAASALLHEQLAKALEMNQIPDFAVVVAEDKGEPTDEVKQKMLDYYGFDHAVYDQHLVESWKQVGGE